MDIEKISKYLLWTLMGISFVIIVAFFLIGFDTPWEENPKMNNPVLLDVLNIWSIILIVVGVVSLLASFTMYIVQHGLDKSIIYTWGLPIVSVGIGVIVGVANKDEHMLINGKDWNIPSDIVITDASIVSIAILTVIAVGVAIWSMVAEGFSKK